MKIKTIASLCKYQIAVCRINGCQWIGDGRALYPLFNLPILDKEQILTMFDVPDKKKESIYFNEIDADIFNFEDNDESEQIVERIKSVSISLNGYNLEPIITSSSIVFLDKKLLSPFADVKSGYEIYERKASNNTIYLAIKTGLILIGIILPNAVKLDKMADTFQHLHDCTLQAQRYAESLKEQQTDLFDFEIMVEQEELQ